MDPGRYSLALEFFQHCPRPARPILWAGQGSIAARSPPGANIPLSPRWSRSAGRGLGAPSGALTSAHPERALKRAADTRNRTSRPRRRWRREGRSARPRVVFLPGGRPPVGGEEEPASRIGDGLSSKKEHDFHQASRPRAHIRLWRLWTLRHTRLRSEIIECFSGLQGAAVRLSILPATGPSAFPRARHWPEPWRRSCFPAGQFDDRRVRSRRLSSDHRARPRR